MQSDMKYTPRQIKGRPTAAWLTFAAALVLAAGFAMPRISAAAEISLSGRGSFKPPSAAQLTALPYGLGFSRADLASGRWSFSVQYDDSIADSDPDPYVGRYVGAIRALHLVIGSTSVDLPVSQAQIVVSDGGGGFPSRESIRLEATSTLSSGLLHLSWVQINQQPQGTDLRGPAGVLASDALPPYTMIANLPTASPFDRYLELRIDPPDGGSPPLLYLSSSTLAVAASPATAP